MNLLKMVFSSLTVLIRRLIGTRSLQAEQFIKKEQTTVTQCRLIMNLRYVKYKITEAQFLFPRYHFKNSQGMKIFSSRGDGEFYPPFHGIGIYEQFVSIPANFLNWGTFYIDLILSTGQKTIYTEPDIISFTLSNKEIPVGMWMGREPGDVTPQFVYRENVLHCKSTN